jgi:hypothetical protein
MKRILNILEYRVNSNLEIIGGELHRSYSEFETEILD